MTNKKKVRKLRQTLPALETTLKLSECSRIIRSIKAEIPKRQMEDFKKTLPQLVILQSRCEIKLTENSLPASWQLNRAIFTGEGRIQRTELLDHEGGQVSYRIIFPWCISLRSEISLMAVLGTPSSSCSSLIFFRAMVSLVMRSLAL